MTLLLQLLAEKGITPENTAKNSLVGQVFGSTPVWAGPEFERIKALPRRRWQDARELLELQEAMSVWYGKTPAAKLYLMQAAVLNELYEKRRVSTVAGLGTGKTLVSALAPVILESKRPLLLNYARLEEKTRKEFRELRDHWKVADNYDFLSVEKLSRENYAGYCERFQPDFICVDEAHSLGDPGGARFRRIRRYAELNPQLPILLLTGTPGTDSLKQYAHLQALLHGQNSPLPLEDRELMLWCEATDAQVRGMRRPPGCLTFFSSGSTDVQAVRDGIQSRIEETPGNIYFREPDGTECSLYISGVKFDGVSQLMNEYCRSARTEETLPDGRCFEEVYDKSLILKQLGCGYAKVLDPIPPEEWRAARGLWAAFVREIVRQEDKYKLDTPFQVSAAVRRDEIDDGGLWREWKEVEPTFTPQHKTEWFDLSVVQFCADWMKEHKGLVWTPSPTFGFKLAEISGLPFFHAQGVSKAHGSIETYTAHTGAILSLGANKLGRNLQDRWNKNLFVTPAASATDLNQAIGRTARPGQKEPVVEVGFLLTVRENWDCVQKARVRALADGRDKASRLLNCDWCVQDLMEVEGWKGPRWHP